MSIGWGIDRVLAVLKWPIGVLSVLLLGPIVYALLLFAARIWQHPWGLIWFVGGIVVYAMLWRPLGQRWFNTDWLLTVEHELTHALFAWLTGHKVKSFQVTAKGGKVEVIGGTNWLIDLAPYFFPTAPLILMLVSVLMPLANMLPWTGVFLGFAMAYHVRSTVIEAHGAKKDWESAGRWFSLAFLPTANLFAIGLVASFAVGGLDASKQLTSDTTTALRWMNQQTQQAISALQRIVAPESEEEEREEAESGEAEGEEAERGEAESEEAGIANCKLQNAKCKMGIVKHKA